MTYNIGTKDNPMVLKTPPLSSEYTMHVDQKVGDWYGLKKEVRCHGEMYIPNLDQQRK